MYVETLRGILFEHASVYRAVTVEEYRELFISKAAHEAEYDRLCEHLSRALRGIDPYLMNLTSEIYEYLELIGVLSADCSEWEIAEEVEEGNMPDRQPSLRQP